MIKVLISQQNTEIRFQDILLRYFYCLKHQTGTDQISTNQYV